MIVWDDTLCSRDRCNMRDTDEQDQRDEDWEDPDPSDQDSHDDPEMVPCPDCGKSIPEIVDFCPHCYAYISQDAPRRSPIWKWVVVIALVAMLSGLFYWLH
jgi:hypothetical protein